MLKDVDNKTKIALDLAKSNSIWQTETVEKIESVEFNVNNFKNEIEELKKKNQDLSSQVDDINKNITMQHTLIFRNIIQEQRRESWRESTSILAQEINKVMPEIQLEQILLKIRKCLSQYH